MSCEWTSVQCVRRFVFTELRNVLAGTSVLMSVFYVYPYVLWVCCVVWNGVTGTNTIQQRQRETTRQMRMSIVSLSEITRTYIQLSVSQKYWCVWVQARNEKSISIWVTAGKMLWHTMYDTGLGSKRRISIAPICGCKRRRRCMLREEEREYWSGCKEWKSIDSWEIRTLAGFPINLAG